MFSQHALWSTIMICSTSMVLDRKFRFVALLIFFFLIACDSSSSPRYSDDGLTCMHGAFTESIVPPLKRMQFFEDSGDYYELPEGHGEVVEFLLRISSTAPSPYLFGEFELRGVNGEKGYTRKTPLQIGKEGVGKPIEPTDIRIQFSVPKNTVLSTLRMGVCKFDLHKLNE